MKITKTQYLYGITKRELNKKLYYVTINVAFTKINQNLSSEDIGDLISNARQFKRIEILKYHKYKILHTPADEHIQNALEIQIDKITKTIKFWKEMLDNE